jgi:hypothetical protein
MPSEVDVYIRKANVFFELLSSIGPKKKFYMSFSGSNFDLYTEVELMEQICTRCPPLLSHIERLQLGGDDDVEYWYARPLTAPWLEFLQPFTAVKTLYLSGSVIMPCLSHPGRTRGGKGYRSPARPPHPRVELVTGRGVRGRALGRTIHRCAQIL